MLASLLKGEDAPTLRSEAAQLGVSPAWLSARFVRARWQLAAGRSWGLSDADTARILDAADLGEPGRLSALARELGRSLLDVVSVLAGKCRLAAPEVP